MDYSGEAVTRNTDFGRLDARRQRGVASAYGGVPVGGTGKRLFDAAFALSLLIAFAPLLILVTIGVKMSAGGPAFYGHTRIGYGGKAFKCWKFRTMVTNGDEVLVRYLQENPGDRS